MDDAGRKGMPGAGLKVPVDAVVTYPLEVAEAMGEIIRMARGAEDLLRTTDYRDGLVHRSLRGALWRLDALVRP